MTTEQQKEIVRVCGENYESSDVPALWRNEDNDSVVDTLEDEGFKWGEEQDCSEDYPLGGMVEPYDIEREKDIE